MTIDHRLHAACFYIAPAAAFVHLGLPTSRYKDEAAASVPVMRRHFLASEARLNTYLATRMLLLSHRALVFILPSCHKRSQPIVSGSALSIYVIESYAVSHLW